MLTARNIVLAVVVLLAAACGGGNGDDSGSASATSTAATATEEDTATTTAEEPEEDAGDFLEGVQEQRLREQYGRAWETLHPAHQAVVSRNQYIDCEQGRGAPPYLELDVDETYEEPVTIEGVGDVPSTAVTMKITVENQLTDKEETGFVTGHVVAVDGEWKWLVAGTDYQAYKSGECPFALE